MGCASASSQRESALNSQIDDKLKKFQQADSEFQKLALMGPRSSGVSTIFKAVQELNGRGSAVCNVHPSEIQHWCYQNALILCQLARDSTAREKLLTLSAENEDDLDAITNTIHAVWHTPNARDVLAAAFLWCEYGTIEDNIAFFFDKIDVIMTAAYIPSQDDILRFHDSSRWRGVQSLRLLVGDSFGAACELMEVPSTLSENFRAYFPKHLSLFEDASAFIFVIPLSDYGRFTVDGQNALVQHAKWFNCCVNSRYARRNDLILFLNKSDIFRRQLLHDGVPFSLFSDDEFVQQLGMSDVEMLKPKPNAESKVGNIMMVPMVLAVTGFILTHYGERMFPLEVVHIIKQFLRCPNEETLFPEEYCEQARGQIARIFTAQLSDTNRVIYVHFTTAIDLDHVQKVMWDVRHMVGRGNLRMMS